MEISPNAFATELSRIIAANIGQRYLIIKLKIFFLRKVPPSATTSSSIFSTPTFLEIKRQVASAAIGIITELVRKSKKSRNCIPMIFTKPSGPYPREERVPRRIMITPTITVAFFLCHLSSSWKVDTALSVRAIELVRAAHSTSTKNRIPMGVPNPILANTLGMVRMQTQPE